VQHIGFRDVARGHNLYDFSTKVLCSESVEGVS
jgi:hypothetical protein